MYVVNVFGILSLALVGCGTAQAAGFALPSQFTGLLRSVNAEKPAPVLRNNLFKGWVIKHELGTEKSKAVCKWEKQIPLFAETNHDEFTAPTEFHCLTELNGKSADILVMALARVGLLALDDSTFPSFQAKTFLLGGFYQPDDQSSSVQSFAFATSRDLFAKGMGLVSEPRKGESGETFLVFGEISEL